MFLVPKVQGPVEGLEREFMLGLTNRKSKHNMHAVYLAKMFGAKKSYLGSVFVP